MRIFLVTDETRFYHPNFVARLIEKTEDVVVGAALVTKIPGKNSLRKYVRKHWYYYKLIEILKLVLFDLIFAIKDYFHFEKAGNDFFSVKRVYQYYNIDYINVEYDINRKEYLNYIRGKEPDVILSSNSLIFKDDLLKIPKICCLNRHSGLLPSYGGLWPVFQAYRNGEQNLGVSVHIMGKSIDKGPVLAQELVKIEEADTISKLYTKCFNLSVKVVLRSLEKVRNKDFSDCSKVNISSYYSFPTKEHWKEFRRRNGRFI